MKKIVKYLGFWKNENHTNAHFPDSSSETDREIQKARNELEVGRLIGLGNFSIVCAGSRLTPEGYESVAVKIPRVEMKVEAGNVQREILIMQQLGKHDFVIELIGAVEAHEISPRPEGIYILTSFCANGSLKNYLRAVNSEKLEEIEQEDKMFDKLFEAVKFAYEIAAGMTYISSKHIIHGDLATRNVLLDEKKTCKISDFGLSRQLSGDLLETGERVEVKEKPWRWMSPEYLDGLLTPSSDVWSFGVTLWEIFTFGECPFATLRWNEEFTEKIRSGRIRLKKPDMADNQIFEIMEKCWNSEFKQRPVFFDLLDFFQSRHHLLRKNLSDQKLQKIENNQPTKIKPHVPSSGKALASDSNLLGEIPKDEFHFDDFILTSTTSGFLHRAVIYGKLAAVRKFSNGYNPENYKYAFSEALNEAKMLASIGEHPFIVGYIGACTSMISQEILYVAMEFCQNGSLLEYLRKIGHQRNSREYQNFPANLHTSEEDDHGKVTQFMRFSMEIASAMSYLSGKQITHNDLAARNILLDGNNSCKLSDFFSSMELGDYVLVKSSQESLPWRWMAAESLTKFEFSFESDVWAYGVTLWEIFSLGDVPYKEYVSWTNDFVDLITYGLRPTQEELMSAEIYGKMRECWNSDPQSRPKFDSLFDFFKILHADQYYLKL